MIQATKETLHLNFKVKDPGELKYFQGIEIMRPPKGILLNQRKYAFSLISEVGLRGSKPESSPLEQNQKLTTIDYDKHVGAIRDEELQDIGRYQKLIGKLIYLTITKPDICFVVQMLSQFMQHPKCSHLEATLRVVRYIKGCPRRGVLLKRNL
ncbi:uncharacterized mitochondrial protein AtMg00810-like [Nicotiana sylvestris]|uniref:uncharacterized mitochondrial protein AtMg00810-like n=1 Tax=Nicotiana sylvestris TaxID=4096 RepID=UPI00388C8D08